MPPWHQKGVIAIASGLQSLLRAFYASLIAIAALSGMARSASAQLYVSELGILTVSEYNATTGAAINSKLITRLSTPSQLAIQGNSLFVANESGSVGKYDAATGAAINPSFITGMQFFPQGLAVQGNILFVANFGFGTVGKYDASTGKEIDADFITAGFPTALALSGNRLFVLVATASVHEYNATTGAAISTNLITRLSAPSGLAVQGNILFVANSGSSRVGKYDATTGEAIDANFITGAGLPTALALLDNTLFVANQSGTVGKYDATTGEAIKANFLTGLQFPTGLAVKRAK
jgi:WD40 repeat protein